MQEFRVHEEKKAASLGLPSYVWRFGQNRRLDLINAYAPLAGKWVLDAGCGIGTYVQQFRRFTPHSFGIELDLERTIEGGRDVAQLAAGSVERLPYPDGTFDVILSHETLEHVGDDCQAAREALRVLKPGGRLVIFVPNRLYPFETHGIYWQGTYHFGNKPFVNYLPDSWRRRLAPHVRAYTVEGLRQLFTGLPARIRYHTQIFPGYDNIVSRRPLLGQSLRRITYTLEQTPLRRFGLSHFMVVEKLDK